MGKLAELLQPRFPTAKVDIDAHSDTATSNMLGEWATMPYAQLSVVLVYLRFLALVHQTHHWIARGDPFYGDHLLFDRLYDTVVKEIDMVAERAVGMGGEQNVNMMLQVDQLDRLVRTSAETQTVPNAGELAKRSLLVECNFLKMLEGLWSSMETEGRGTMGCENLLQGIADTHEGHVYLLKRRCQVAAMGL